ncbi:glutamate receptor 2.7-like [Salvia hispanica]|uniref:glutamate receptor 2.7-like n=1 Tax=Salvia hispanica TaxID=49212 RepID=UPI002009D14B|nr:glutamate receptor 2.7-like [Salvia hispanica]
MPISKLTFFTFLFLFDHFTNAAAAKVDVGIILDLQTPLGKMFKTCISMAIEDFYSKNTYKTMIVPHFRDSSSDIVSAASAAIDLLKNTQVIAIFGPQASIQADFVIDIGDRVKVPIISPATSPSLSPQESPFFIRSSWCSASQAKAVAAIVNHFDWREVVLVYEDTIYGIGLLPFLTERFLESNALVSNMTAISPSADNDLILEKLLELRRMQTRVFVVHMLPPVASRFFKMARRAGMMGEGYAWIIADALTSLLDSVDSETIEAMQGVVGVKAYFPRSSEVHNFTGRWRKRFRQDNPALETSELNVFGLWAYDSITALAESVERVRADASPRFNKTAVGRGNLTDMEAIGVSNSGPRLAPLLRNFTSKGLSGDFMIKNGELQASVFEIMNVVGNGANTVGFWRENQGISKRFKGDDDVGDIKHTLGAVVWPGQTSEAPRGWEAAAVNARKLRVGVPMKCRAGQLVNVSIDEETGKVNASGFCIEMFEEAMRSLPYPVQFEYIPFKNADQNSTIYNYDSLIQQLALKRVDAVVADITMSASRAQQVDFTIPYIESGISTVVLIKDKENTWDFMAPLTRDLWITIGGTFIFTGFVVWVLEHRLNEEFRGPPHKQIGMIFWFAFSTLTFSQRERVKSNLSRFVVIVWLFVVLVLSTSYTANLTSLRTVNQLASTDYRNITSVGFKEGSFVRAVLGATLSDNSKLTVYTTFEEYDKGLSLGSSRGGVDAVVDNVPSLKVFLYKYCNKYTMSGLIHRNSGFGFAFQKGSPLAPDVSREILMMKETGKRDQISRKWFGEGGCSSNNTTDADSRKLDVKNFSGLFYITGLSSLSALLIFLVTFLYDNRLVWSSDASLKHKLLQLAQRFDHRESDNELLPFSKKSAVVCEEMVAAEMKSKPKSCICCEQGKWSTIQLWFRPQACYGDGLESLDLDRFTGLFLIAGLSSSMALAVFFSGFFYENRHILASSASVKKKLHSLARAFVGRRSIHSESEGLSQSPSIRTCCDEEGMFSQDEGLSTVDIEMQEANNS